MRQEIFEIIELDKNDNLISKVYDRIMQVAIVVSIIPLMFRGNNVIFTTIESVVTILFVADYLLRWLTADLRSKNNNFNNFFLFSRRERDSNPRYPFEVHTLSRRAP